MHVLARRALSHRRYTATMNAPAALLRRPASTRTARRKPEGSITLICTYSKIFSRTLLRRCLVSSLYHRRKPLAIPQRPPCTLVDGRTTRSTRTALPTYRSCAFPRTRGPPVSTPWPCAVLARAARSPRFLPAPPRQLVDSASSHKPVGHRFEAFAVYYRRHGHAR